MDATLKSALGSPLTGLVYAASLAVGVITLLAFYESPISPLPVPSLPKPPVGRFPPEHAIWPPISKHAMKAEGGHQYGNGAASNQQFQFQLPAGLNKLAHTAGQYVGGYEKSNGLGQGHFAMNNNGIDGGYGGQMAAAASNLYQTVVPAQNKRLSLQQGRPLSAQVPVIQRKTGHVETSPGEPSSASSEPIPVIASPDEPSPISSGSEQN